MIPRENEIGSQKRGSMRDSLRDVCERFIQDRANVQEAFKWNCSTYLIPVCAAMLAGAKEPVSLAKLEECKRMLKTGVGVFSNFKGNAFPALVTQLALDENPQERLRKAIQMHDILKQYFYGSAYLPLAAMVLSGMVQEARFSEVAERAGRLYKKMKAEHRFLTSNEDCVYASLMALSGLNDDQLIQDAESSYKYLKEEFYDANANQSLSHVLALCEGSAGSKCRAVFDLYRSLREKKYKYGTGYELATLGVLSLLPQGKAAVMADLIEIDSYLSMQKGYGFFGLGKKQRLMHAGMILVSEVLENESGAQKELYLNAATNSAVAMMIAAQQAALCAAVAATAAAQAAAT